MPELMSWELRWRFWEMALADASATYDLPEETGQQASGEALFEMQQRFSRQAMGALDQEMALSTVQRLFSEAAVAAKYWLETKLTPGGRQVFWGLFAFAVAGDKKAQKEYAKLYLERAAVPRRRRPVDYHILLLAEALSKSIVGDDKGAAATLNHLKKIPYHPHKISQTAYGAEMLKLARACLVETRQRHLTPLLQQVAHWTRKHIVSHSDLEDNVFEPSLNRIALSLLAQGKARGLKLPEENPDGSMRLELLRLPPRLVPRHPWYRWPKPPPRHFAAVKWAFDHEYPPDIVGF